MSEHVLEQLRLARAISQVFTTPASASNSISDMEERIREHCWRLEDRLSSAESNVRRLERTIEALQKQVQSLKDQIDYAPGGPGYDLAKSDFDTQKGIQQEQKKQ